MFDAKMVEYMKSVRTLTQAQVDEIAKAKVWEHVPAAEYYEAHGHHAEHA